MSFGKEVKCAVCGRVGSSLSMALVPDGKGGQTFVCRKGNCKDTWINDYLHEDLIGSKDEEDNEQYDEMIKRIQARNSVLRPDEFKKSILSPGFENWEKNVNRYLSQDSQEIYKNLKGPVKDCFHAIDQMVGLDGKSVGETHGALSGYIIERDYGIDKWDKNHEYRNWVLETMLKEEENFVTPISEDEWMAVEAYAVDSTINDKIIHMGNIFRKHYQECSKKHKCVKKEELSEHGRSMHIDNVCRKKCLEEAADKTQYFTEKELDDRRKRRGTYI